MGKTAAGAVWLNPDRLPPYDYWQFWRNTEDADVARFLALFTELPMDEVRRLGALAGAEINEAKKLLATEATALLHGRAAAEAAAETARRAFEQGEAAATLPSLVHALPAPLADLLVAAKLVASKGEARRLVAQNGVRLNDAPVGRPAAGGGRGRPARRRGQALARPQAACAGAAGLTLPPQGPAATAAALACDAGLPAAAMLLAGDRPRLGGGHAVPCRRRAVLVLRRLPVRPGAIHLGPVDLRPRLGARRRPPLRPSLGTIGRAGAVLPRGTVGRPGGLGSPRLVRPGAGPRRLQPAAVHLLGPVAQRVAAVGPVAWPALAAAALPVAVVQRRVA